MRATARIWLPFVAAALLMVATAWAGPILTWILMIAAIGLILDGATLLWSRAGSLRHYRQ
jgi:hypothetical protein